jgi:hypothetical protein
VNLQQLGTTALLTLHLLCVQLASSGPLVAIWLDWLDGRGNRVAGEAGRWLAVKSVWLLLLGALLGLGLALLLWDGAYQQTLSRFQRRIELAVWEFLFSLLLMSVVAIWWSHAEGSGWGARLSRALLIVLASTNLLYHFPLLLIVISDTTAAPLAFGAVDGEAFRQLAASGSVISRAMHFTLASVGVAAVALMAFTSRQAQKDATNRAPWEKLLVQAGRLALAAVVVQLPIGVWLVTQLTPSRQRQLLGSDPLAATLLAAAIAATLWLLHLLSAVALGETSHRSTNRAVGVMILTVLLMTGVAVRLDG